MARSKRKSTRRNPKRRRSSSLARRRTGFALNPRRRHAKRRRTYHANPRRRRYRRNPMSMNAVLGSLKGLAIGTAGVLGGVAVGNYVCTTIGPKLLPQSATDTPTTIAGKNLLVAGALAVGIAVLGRKVSPEIAGLVAIGVLVKPATQLIYAVAPASAAGFLGNGVTLMPGFPRAGRVVSGYAGTPRTLPRGGASAYPDMAAYPSHMSAYPQHQPG